ncbi:hypothetical protein I6H96_02520 [Brucella anthropi]|uniref:Uncharacterized protein n=2 Tax=Brucella anthropi TaxID=529 RepID=A6WZ26_BRUA4|nr:hypothetical protein [Brucella anthropi]ABS14230.1 hypothetical protein Oant_1514 [Brucella anthropi ATCC 49188]NKC48118.1 hypothetical protein [Brucella anthropi ATCC 49188]QQC25756.1 hypothetical protein I6H96_02520 [Brucella anthropi]SUA65536.1 Uncharacterised protein [Brucella anthropi]
MVRPNKLSNTEFRKAMIRYTRGDGVRQIAKDFGISPAALHQRAKRLGLSWGGKAAREARAKQKRLFEQAIEAQAKAAKPIAKAEKPKSEPKSRAKVSRSVPQVALIVYPKTISEVVRLHRLGRTRTEIASLLRMPYRQIDAAIELGSHG